MDSKNTILIKKFNKVYLDTIQHSKNIKIWIDSSKRKKGDLNRSIKHLENKHKELYSIKQQLEKNGIEDQSILQTTSKNNSIDDYKNLVKNIKSLYTSTQLKIPKELYEDEKRYLKPKGIYGYKIDCVEDLQGKVIAKPMESNFTIGFKNLKKQIKRFLGIDTDYEEYLQENENLIIETKFGEKAEKFLEKCRNIIGKPKKAIIGLASLLLVSAMTFAGGIVVGESSPVSKSSKNTTAPSHTTNLNKTPKKILITKILQIYLKLI